MATRASALFVVAVVAGCGPSARPTPEAPSPAPDRDTGQPRAREGKPQVSVLLGQDGYKKAAPLLAVGKKLKFRGELLGAAEPGAVVRVHLGELYTGDEAAVQATDLTREYRTDWAGAKEKYKSKNIPYDLTVIEGVVAELLPDDFMVLLVGDDGKAVTPPALPPAPGLPSPAGVGPGDEDLSKVKPDLTMKCQEWEAAIADPKDREKYKGKVIELTGVVASLSHTDTPPHEQPPRDTYLSINDPDSKIAIGPSVIVKGKDAWKLVLPGQTVTLRGRYSPAHFQVLRGAQIVSVSGRPFGSVTVEELVAAARNPVEANARYGEFGRSYLLAGKVLAVRKAASSPALVEFVMTPAGAKPPLVVGVAVSFTGPAFAQVKEGQSIKVLGRLQAQEDETRFFADALLEAK